MTPLLALGWAALACSAVLARRPAPARRVDSLVVGGPAHHARLQRRVALPALTLSKRTVAIGLPAVAASAMVFPPLALALLGVAAVRPVVRRRRAAARAQAAVERDVADVVTLIGLAVNSGHNLLGALRAAAAHADGPLARGIGAAAASVDHGRRLADAIEELPDHLGEVVRPVVVALISCDRYGAPLGPTLDRLAADVRVAARQRAEAAARKLPIRLLFPLVSCILPAFGLLTVAPLIAGSLRELRL